MPITKATQNVITPNICTTDTNQTVSGEKSFTGNVSTSNLINSTSLCFRNKIINGDMVIRQRRISDSEETVNNSNPFVFTLDRWQARNETATNGTFSVRRASGGGSGFARSLEVRTLTANASIPANAGFCITQNIEGHNIADLKWGTPNALPITISFWYQSSYSFSRLPIIIQNNSYDMICAVSFLTNNTGSWEKKTITIPGPTSGTWETGSAIGMRIIFGLAAGDERRVFEPEGTWSSGGTQLMTGTETSINYLAFTNRYLYITGVQVEAGSVATPFEFRPIGTELALCQRYAVSYGQDGGITRHFASGIWNSTTTGTVYLGLPVEMRTVPTFSIPSGTGLDSFSVTNVGSVGSLAGGTLLLNADQSSDTTAAINFSTFDAFGTTGNLTRLIFNTIFSRITLSAEL
jgi:hypothetical protein